MIQNVIPHYSYWDLMQGLDAAVRLSVQHTHTHMLGGEWTEMLDSLRDSRSLMELSEEEASALSLPHSLHSDESH